MQGQTQQPGQMRRRGLRPRRPSITTILLVVLTASLALFLATSFDIDIRSVLTTIGRSDPTSYLLAVAVYYASFLVRGVRWRLIVARVNSGIDEAGPAPTVLKSSLYVLLARFADSIAWLRLGNLYRAYLASGSEMGSFSRNVGTLVAELFLDSVVVFAGLAVLAAYAAAGSADYKASGAVAAAAAATTVAALGMAAMWRLGSRLTGMLPSRARSTYVHFRHGTLDSLVPRDMPVLLGLTVLAWLSAVARWYFVIKALGLSVSMPLIVFASLLNALLAAVPITPGGLGIIEPGMVGVLVTQVSAEDAIAATLLERSISYLSLLAVGATLFFAREALVRSRARRRQPSLDD